MPVAEALRLSWNHQGWEVEKIGEREYMCVFLFVDIFIGVIYDKNILICFLCPKPISAKQASPRDSFKYAVLLNWYEIIQDLIYTMRLFEIKLDKDENS